MTHADVVGDGAVGFRRLAAQPRCCARAWS